MRRKLRRKLDPPRRARLKLSPAHFHRRPGSEIRPSLACSGFNSRGAPYFVWLHVRQSFVSAYESGHQRARQIRRDRQQQQRQIDSVEPTVRWTYTGDAQAQGSSRHDRILRPNQYSTAQSKVDHRTRNRTHPSRSDVHAGGPDPSHAVFNRREKM
jgi:hypothetical protein